MKSLLAGLIHPGEVGRFAPWTLGPILLTFLFLAWTGLLLTGPALSKSKTSNKLTVSLRLDHTERALADLIVGSAVIPSQPADEALRRWRVLFVSYRRQLEQLDANDPAVQEIAEHLGRVHALVGQAEGVRQGILAGKYTLDEQKTRDREFRQYIETASGEIRAASASLRRSASEDAANPLAAPFYPSTAGALALILLILFLLSDRKSDRTAQPDVAAPGTFPPPLVAEERSAAEMALATPPLKELYFEPNGMDAMRRLAGCFAHNFNNLLTTINGYAGLLLSCSADDDPNRSDLDEIKTAGNRAAFLTGQLLAFSGRQVANPQLLDLNVFIRNIEDSLPPLLGPRIVLDLDLSVELSRIMIDPEQLEHVILSLVLNARDAMPGGGTLTIATANAKSHQIGPRPRPCRNPCVVLTFRDTGAGMDEETREQIFEPFFTTREPGKGTGLGLSAAYGIVRQNGGRIRVRSDKGRGSTLTVYLPAAEEGAEWAGAAELRAPESRFHVASMRKRD